jgi:hypothetical protein
MPIDGIHVFEAIATTPSTHIDGIDAIYASTSYDRQYFLTNRYTFAMNMHATMTARTARRLTYLHLLSLSLDKAVLDSPPVAVLSCLRSLKRTSQHRPVPEQPNDDPGVDKRRTPIGVTMTGGGRESGEMA